MQKCLSWLLLSKYGERTDDEESGAPAARRAAADRAAAKVGYTGERQRLVVHIRASEQGGLGVCH